MPRTLTDRDLVAYENLTTPIWLFEPSEEEVLWANQAALDFWQVDSVERLRAPERREALQCDGPLQCGTAPSGCGVHQSKRSLRPDGATADVNCRCSHVHWNGRRVLRVEVTALGATAPLERRGLEAVHHTTVMIALFTPEGALLYQNPAAQTVFGAGDALAGFQDRFETPHEASLARQRLAVDSSWTGEVRAITLHGPRWHRVDIRRTIDPLTGQIAHLVNRTDIHEQKAIERAIFDAKRAAEVADTAKSAFLASMSHELRTPLNAILGYSEMLAEDFEDQPDVADDLNRILISGQHLLSLINNVLDLSKIEAGEIILNRTDVDVATVVREVMNSLVPQARARGNTLDIAVDPDVGVVSTDRLRLGQILLNLGSNACKFTKKGLVSIGVHRSGDDLLFRVADTGIGMTNDQMAHIFEPFKQATERVTSAYGGTGLGLTLCRDFVGLLGGWISVDSEVGVGSEFTVVMPLPRMRRTHTEPRAAALG